jgi:hypothetical protein
MSAEMSRARGLGGAWAFPGSVAPAGPALTRQDGVEFFRTIADLAIRTEVEPFVLEDANTALIRLENGQVRGAAVLRMGPT